MRDAIKVSLQAWASRLEAQNANDDDNHKYDFFLDYKVLGIATFLKQIAYEHDDLELLAIASKVEMRVEQMIEEDDEADRERQDTQEQEYEADQKIRNACIHYFYTEPAFLVDMSKYQTMIQTSGAIISDAKKIAGLRRYVDSQQVLGKIYEKVKNHLRRTCAVGGVPTLDKVSIAFDIELREIYRLADIHVARVLTQHGGVAVEH